MASGVFCGKCGTPAAEEGDAFCRKCGAAFSSQVLRRPPTFRPSGGTPAWPWGVAFIGLLLCAIFGAKAFAAYEVVRRVEASSAVTVAKGLDLVGRLFGAGNLGAAIDPRNQALYAEAKQQLVGSALIAAFGLIVLLVALLVAAASRPGVEQASMKKPMTAVDAYWTVWTSVGVLVLVLAFTIWAEQDSHAIQIALSGAPTLTFALLAIGYVACLVAIAHRVMMRAIEAMEVWPHWPKKPPVER